MLPAIFPDQGIYVTQQKWFTEIETHYFIIWEEPINAKQS